MLLYILLTLIALELGVLTFIAPEVVHAIRTVAFALDAYAREGRFWQEMRLPVDAPRAREES